MKLVFVHGWGFEKSFWTSLMDLLPGYDTGAVDFGFFGAAADIPVAEDAVYITHSLGTLWALRHRAETMRAIVAVNGFTNFLDFSNAKVLGAMQKRLGREPQAQMEDFWALCGARPKAKALNVPRLQEGLSWLGTWKESAPDVPVMVLAGDQDKVTMIEKMRKQWAEHDLHVCAGGGHVLPVTHADWCAARIEEFLKNV